MLHSIAEWSVGKHTGQSEFLFINNCPSHFSLGLSFERKKKKKSLNMFKYVDIVNNRRKDKDTST